MDLQTRKLNLISYLAQIQDESILKRIENFIVKSKDQNNNKDITPFTVEELISRIQKSEQDFDKGNFKTQAELEKLSENW